MSRIRSTVRRHAVPAALLLLVWPALGRAQTGDADALATAQRLLQLTRAEQLVEQSLGDIRENLVRCNPDKAAAIDEAIEAVYRPEMQQAWDAADEALAQRVSAFLGPDEVGAVLAFLNSGTGAEYIQLSLDAGAIAGEKPQEARAMMQAFEDDMSQEEKDSFQAFLMSSAGQKFMGPEAAPLGMPFVADTTRPVYEKLRAALEQNGVKISGC